MTSSRPQAARGTMPFPGHRTQARVRADEAASTKFVTRSRRFHPVPGGTQSPSDLEHVAGAQPFDALE